ncbi:MAG: hypothetical protein C6P37_12325 [Caldibacillus debilis]|uniref:Uncharacterized protein n=1 Tax=Caldibacillus debilis TaxID=301148 RepID=A0A3E0K2A8_9BACI|nr:hypothetical protein [Bacillaceae bacterium]MBY6273334.1 hypothetical protein [Bacillaceae bacterium]REJ27234.1 MAG: hypothetical protein C6P37_12325 [Caldibacillus debilis]
MKSRSGFYHGAKERCSFLAGRDARRIFPGFCEEGPCLREGFLFFSERSFKIRRFSFFIAGERMAKIL